MRVIRRVLVLVVILLAVAVPSALAWNGNADRVLFGEDLELLPDDAVTGDLLVFGGDVHLHQGSQVEGDLFIMGGELRVAGEVLGDVVLLGGSAELEAPAVVGGDILALGGTIDRSEGASVGGTVTEGFAFRFIPQIQNARLPSGWQSNWNPASTARSWTWRGARSVLWSIVLAFVSILVMAIWPRQTQLVSRTLWRYPGACVGAGVIGSLIAAAVIVALVITICLSPIAALLLAAGWLFGWCALGLLVGQRLLTALKVRNLAPLWQTAVGVLILSLVGSLPWVGWLVWVLAGMYAFGAVVLTRLGTRSYDGSGAPTAVLDEVAAVDERQAEEDGEPPVPTVDATSADYSSSEEPASVADDASSTLESSDHAVQGDLQSDEMS